MEGMKNFPQFSNNTGLVWFDGERGPYPDSIGLDPSIPATIPDGYIFSGGRQDVRDVVNNPNVAWPRTNVIANQYLDIRWHVTASHRYRGFRYFITRPDWLERQSPNSRPRRTDFESEPFASIFNRQREFWTSTPELMSAPIRGPSTRPTDQEPYEPGEYDATHTIRIPGGRKGHHIILGIMIVADAGNGFYSAFDVDISG